MSILQQAQQQLKSFLATHRELSPNVVTFAKNTNHNLQNYTIPLFKKNFDSTTQYYDSLETRLFELEQSISVYLLQEISHALRHLAHTVDDYQYLYYCTNLLFSNLIANYQTIVDQANFKHNYPIQLFMQRLIAWHTMMQNRRNEIFAHYQDNDYQLQHQKAEKVLYHLYDIVEVSAKNEAQLQKQLQQLYKKEDEIFTMFWLKKLFVKKPNFTQLIHNILEKIYDIRQKTYLDIILMNKNYPLTMLKVEFMSTTQSSTSQSYHLYALNMGENGFSRLPILVHLPKDKKFFDIHKIQTNLVNDYNRLNQRWFVIAQNQHSTSYHC